MEAKNTELTTQLQAEKSKGKSGKSEAKVREGGRERER
jgi:hypothetical protein